MKPENLEPDKTNLGNEYHGGGTLLIGIIGIIWLGLAGLAVGVVVWKLIKSLQ